MLLLGVCVVLAAAVGAHGAPASLAADGDVQLAAVDPEKPFVNEGSPLRLRLVDINVKAPRALHSCAAVTPQGRVQLQPAEATKAKGRVKYDGQGGGLDDGRCGLAVDALRAEDAGVWVLEAVVADGGATYRANTTVGVNRPRMLVLPAEVHAEVGDEVLLTLQFQKAPAKDPAWQVCTVKKPDGAVVQVARSGKAADADADVVLDASSDLLRGKCVVRVTLSSPADNGKFWTISAGTGGEVPRAAQSRIYVNGPYVAVGGAQAVLVGAKSVPIYCGPKENVLACELKDPAGQPAVSVEGPCVYTLDWVNADHAGRWTCSVVLDGYTNAVSDSVQLTVDEPAQVETGVARDGDGVTLRCAVAAGCATGQVHYCRMVAPDGSSVLLKEGVSRQGEYAYAGKGFAHCDCSMRILGAPRDAHLGVWRCYMMGSARGARPRGGLIHLAKEETRAARSEPSAGVDVVAFTNPASGFVPPGTALTVGCRAQRALSYCFLRTPLGQRLLLNEASALAGPTRDVPVVYGGKGFAFGECAARMVMAVNMSGTWHCGVGVLGAGTQGPAMDVEVPVPVTVSESQAVAVQTNVTASLGSKDVVLACRAVLGVALKYCRFHRPDGSSVHLADASPAGLTRASTAAADKPGFPYRYAGGELVRGHCGVAIASVGDADFGSWTCVVALVGDPLGTEHTATLSLQPASLGAGVDAALSGMAVALATLVLAGAAVVIYRRYFRHPPSAASSTESVPLEEPRAGSLRASPGSRASRGRPRTSAAARVMQTSHLPARTSARTRTRSARRESLEQAEAGMSVSDSSPEPRFESPRTARKSQ